MGKKEKLLITGGSGMVGRNLLESNLINQWHVIRPRKSELDLTNSISLQNYLNCEKPDLIIHAAGLVGGIQANIKNPVSFMNTNVLIGNNVITCAYQAGIRKFINLGSACMYPRGHTEPLSEKMILSGELEPTNEGYALAKIVAAKMCTFIRRENPKFYYKTLIPCNLFGRYDKFDPENSHLLPAIIHKIFKAKERNISTVEIWGDGTARREFMYTGDLADAVLKAALDVEKIPDLLNIGLGRDYSITDYYSIVRKIIGWQGEFRYNSNMPAGMRRKLLSIKLQKEWGWSAQTDLETGVKKTIEYYKETYRQ